MNLLKLHKCIDIRYIARMIKIYLEKINSSVILNNGTNGF